MGEHAVPSTGKTKPCPKIGQGLERLVAVQGLEPRTLRI